MSHYDSMTDDELVECIEAAVEQGMSIDSDALEAYAERIGKLAAARDALVARVAELEGAATEPVRYRRPNDCVHIRAAGARFCAWCGMEFAEGSGQ